MNPSRSVATDPKQADPAWSMDGEDPTAYLRMKVNRALSSRVAIFQRSGGWVCSYETKASLPSRLAWTVRTSFWTGTWVSINRFPRLYTDQTKPVSGVR